MGSAAAPSKSPFERIYSLVVLVKGIDGAVELILGCVLLLAPAAAGQVLQAAAVELAEGTSSIRVLLASGLGAAGQQIASGTVPLAVFLLVHGVVKLLTVYCLLRRLLRWYPWAIAVLSLLLVVQLVDVIVRPGIGGGVLAALDLLVLALVVWEFVRLRRGEGASGSAQEHLRARPGVGARTGRR